MKTSCKNIQNQLVSLLSDELSESKQRQLEQHLESCDECREELAHMKETWNALGAIPHEQPDEQMEEQFEVMLRAYKRGMQEVDNSGAAIGVVEWIRSLFSQPAWKFAVPAFMLIVGFVLGTRVNSGAGKGDYAAISSELDDMRQLVMMSLLKQESSVDRLQAVKWSYEVEQPQDQVRDMLRRTFAEDKNVNVRLAALRALEPYADQPVVRQDIVNSFSRQRSPLVQTEIIDFIRRNESRPADLLRILAQDKELNMVVKQHLEWNIGLIEGETYYKENKNESSTHPNRIFDLPADR